MNVCPTCHRIHPSDAVRASNRFASVVTTRYRARVAGAPWRTTREAAHADWCAEMRRMS